MFRVSKCLSGFVPMLQSLRQLRAKHGRRCYVDSDDDEQDDDVVRKRDGDNGQKLYFYKSRGQNILSNPRILDTIVRRSAIKPTDTVLEIGPGTGNLTMKLLEAAQKVVAIEIDERMVDVLQNRVTEEGLLHKLTVSSITSYV